MGRHQQMIDPEGYLRPQRFDALSRGLWRIDRIMGDDYHGADALDLRRLGYFSALGKELHFGRAADRLQIAQPPLSRLVARIEADVGVKLIDRSRSQIRLTQAGEVLLARTRVLLKQRPRVYGALRHY
jgi:hypothetical protein